MAGLLPTPEQDELRALVRGIAADRAPGRRDAIAAGGDASAWKILVEQVGVCGLAVPEAWGGTGQGWAEVAVVAEELGRGLLPVPLLSTILATAALLEVSDDPLAGSLLERLGSGQARATLLMPLGADPLGVETRCEAGRLRGGAPIALEAAGADLVLAFARDETGIGLHLLEMDRAQAVERVEVLDLTRPMHRVDVEDVPAQRLGAPDEGRAVSAVQRVGRFVLAAEQVGGAGACLEMAVAHALGRQQFDRPIGSFQSIKHQLADAFVNVEAAVAAVADASRSASPGSDGERFDDAVRVAASTAGDAFHDNAELNIHVHGGIGFTWEHDAHLYYRRAVATNALFGHPRTLDRTRGAQLAAPR